MPVIVDDIQHIVVSNGGEAHVTVVETPNNVHVTDIVIGETISPNDNKVTVDGAAPTIIVQGVGIEGPQGDVGPKGDKGDDGSSADSRYIHTQVSASNSWFVQHNLNRDIAVAHIEDSSGRVYANPDFTTIDQNSLTIDLYYATSGKAVIV